MHDAERWSERERQEALKGAFRLAFGPDRPTHLARAPGRVNLIGEHTDYNGLPVFPMAIQRDVVLSFRARDDGLIRLCNVDPQYGPREFWIEDTIVPFGPGEPGERDERSKRVARGDWGNYAKSAAQELRKRCRISRGIDAAVHGGIPSAAGLSSSSAMVVATALALVQANGVRVERTVLMSLTADAERYVGTQSGGMDQAISLGGRRGAAAVIEFEPLRLTHVRVPPSWCFVVANTLVRAEKSGAAQAAYNQRTLECREALRLFAMHPSARELSIAAPSERDRPRKYVELVRDVPIEALLEIATQALSEPLRRRFRHVVSEGKRVEAARRAMQAEDRAAFGDLMNASHASLRDDYEVSCPELDRLTDAARAAGVQGARLTGAGFGGCIVALCDRAIGAELVERLRAELARAHGDLPADAVMIAEASEGARTLRC